MQHVLGLIVSNERGRGVKILGYRGISGIREIHINIA